MFRNIISPVQAWLLSQGRCVGCGTPLKPDSKAKVIDSKSKEVKVICKKCGRIFLLNLETKKYRRAPL